LIHPDFRQKNLRGLRQNDRNFGKPKILLKLEVRGKSRWPFGWQRELAIGDEPRPARI
jgi:hypothetical protein